jgi:ABC-type branched-subunit amino acid transport system ATPase component
MRPDSFPLKSSPILELRHLTHSFSRSKPILKDISFKLFPGQSYTLMGANGSGKTTLFNLIGGYIRPDLGKIFVRGRNVTSLRPNHISRLGVARTFQKPRIIKQLTLLENVILAMQHNETDIWYKSLIPRFVFSDHIRTLQDRAKRILERVLLQDAKDELAASISYGQQKMLNIACAVASEAMILLLDEPLAGLSPVYARNLCGLVVQLKAEGKTILMIEHSQELTRDVTDQYFLLDRNGLRSYITLDSLLLDMIEGTRAVQHAD